MRSRSSGIGSRGRHWLSAFVRMGGRGNTQTCVLVDRVNRAAAPSSGTVVLIVASFRAQIAGIPVRARVQTDPAGTLRNATLRAVRADAASFGPRLEELVLGE